MSKRSAYSTTGVNPSQYSSFLVPYLATLKMLLFRFFVYLCLTLPVYCRNKKEFLAQSGLRPWVDISTPESAYTTRTSRGQTWNLVMSDEFNVPGRDFRPGKDYIWTAVDLPDGVNDALQYYSPNMTSTQVDSDGVGYFQIRAMEDVINFTVYNMYTRPPKFIRKTMYYRAGMIQSWNKFCVQGGKIEVRAKLPGVLSNESQNPDLKLSKKHRVTSTPFYPTWPGIWLLGNLGRALFTASTNRMWPWSFSECDESLSSSQRISACNESPGHGLNPRQGRGAPEIDILEGGGDVISCSIQVAPGIPEKYRRIEMVNETYLCVYGYYCNTRGANLPNVPTEYYQKKIKGAYAWYKGLRYGANTHCDSNPKQIQDPRQIHKSVNSGIEENKCSLKTCPASMDVKGDLTLIDGVGPEHWGINEEGRCMATMNSYMGGFLCDPDNTDQRCTSPRKTGQQKYEQVPPFNYQMDALSANYPVHIEAYTDYMSYEIEWVMGPTGYIRWMLNDVVVYEIPSEVLTNPPDDGSNDDPKKLMVEEPMYLIFNVALSERWATKPPNFGSKCRGDGNNDEQKRICDGFPMDLKIDYVRIWQDTSSDSTMSIGCDPKTHPTKEFINDHISDYTNKENPWIEVIGGAPCTSNADCSLGSSYGVSYHTGYCSSSNKCVCYTLSWIGPRCTSNNLQIHEYGPSLLAVLVAVGSSMLMTVFLIFYLRSQKGDNKRIIEPIPSKKKNLDYYLPL